MEQVYPGDLIDIGGGYNHIYPQWWHDIKDQMENKHQLRKCEFLERIPDSGDRCPGVATHTDKYYCIFGTDLKPSWYCTCFERIGEYKFHCNSYDLIIEDTIEELEEEEADSVENNEANRTEQEMNIDEAIQDAILYTSINENNNLDEDHNNNNNNNNNNNEDVIHPGDCIDEDCGYRHIEPQWWHDIKDTMVENSHLLRKCDFLDRIPNTNDNCPGVASHSDHYYCIFGTSQKPLWYCTCYEHVGDYKFHCNADDIRTVDDILKEETASDVATFAIDHIDNAIQHSVAYERDEDEEQQDSSPIALIPPDKVNLISTTSGESPRDDNTATLKNSNTNNNGNHNFLHPHHHSKWSTGFSFGVGFSIGILAAAMMITVYLRILHRRARHRFINEEVCDPTLGTTTYQTPIPPPPPPPPMTSPRGRMMSSTSPRSPPLRLPIPPTGVVMQNLLWDNQGFNEEDEWEVDREQREQLRQLTKNSFSVV